MAKEIERKFLVKGDGWRNLGVGSVYRQGYIATQKAVTVRVRIANSRGYLTIKSPSVNYSRAEFEYEVPLADAQEMLDTLCDRPLIEKVRYKVKLGDLTWEIDEFDGDNKGLIVAEVELSNEKQQIELPEWIGEEVSHESRYFNSNLARFPFSKW